MQLTAGARLGPYVILDAIGAGGMGEVYRARDAKLNRDVALKILPEAFTLDGDRVARFRREAQLLASLNHPNIAAIYGFEDSGDTHALVLELVEGPTLADRIANGPIPLDEALSIAKQIAEALEAAHEQGIVHRDLKPANIKLRDDGTVKVLDFGLAKAMESTPVSVGATMSPTISIHATQAGIILGTAAYMSPEQAVGKPVDKRSDLWAFGVVLLEMLTGRRAFEGETVSDVLASVLKDAPDWSALPATTPVAIRTLLRRCLEKDRKQRLPDAAMIRLEVADAREEAASGARPGGVGTTPSTSLVAGRGRMLTSAILGAVIVGAAAWVLRPVPAAPVVARFSFQPPEGQDLRVSARTTVGVSPDGMQLAYVARSQGTGRIFVRSIGELSFHAVPGAEGSSVLGPIYPTFAPDGQSIAFFRPGGPSWELSNVPIGGGTPRRIATSGEPQGLYWGQDGIVYADAQGLYRVSASGGAPQRIVMADGVERMLGPQMLPDGNTVLFTIKRTADLTGEGQVVAQALAGGARRVLVEEGSDGRYLPSGHVIYSLSGAVFALPVDPRTLTRRGEAVPVIVGVRRGSYVPGPRAEAQLAVSATGTLIYMPGPATAQTWGLSNLVLGGDASDPVPLGVKPAAYEQPRVSPDGRMVAVGRDDGPSSDIWLYDLSGKSEMRRLTFGGKSRFPVWSADSRQVTFQSALDGDAAIFRQLADGGRPERLTKPAEGEAHVPEAWSHDGAHLLFSIVKGSTRSLWFLTLRDRTIERFGNVESSAPLSASFSLDNRWVVYAVESSGQSLLSQDRGVFVEPFPPTGEKHQAPKTAIDYHPVWAPDGSSIFYASAATQPLVSVPVSVGASITFGASKIHARAPRPTLTTSAVREYDVLRDGRILSLSPTAADGTSETSTSEIRVVLNWFTELKQRAPAK
jgi:eukaryotic-like serine/threonine-protein kinase